MGCTHYIVAIIILLLSMLSHISILILAVLCSNDLTLGISRALCLFTYKCVSVFSQ